MQIAVENIKCGGCATSIKNALLKFENVSDVGIDIEQEIITLTTSSEVNEVSIIEKLAQLGYPEKGKNNLISKAKSYVSCAIGKVQS